MEVAQRSLPCTPSLVGSVFFSPSKCQRVRHVTKKEIVVARMQCHVSRLVNAQPSPALLVSKFNKLAALLIKLPPLQLITNIKPSTGGKENPHLLHFVTHFQNTISYIKPAKVSTDTPSHPSDNHNIPTTSERFA